MSGGDEMQAQYEAYPYPERDPRDEAKRLITGSPSWPVEMDHWIWGGARDWSAPLKVLVAGGGTGDALIQLAQVLTSAGRPYDITYVDLSTASRQIAEARAAQRGLSGITFHTGSLLDATDYGVFDYVDCCGVLHHLPDPQAGFNALSKALAPGGGIGLMVYAPLGRSGVYPLQAAFGQITRGNSPEERLAQAKAIFAKLPEGHPFKCNPHLVDHKQGDAGFYDLLLHSSDRPYRISELLEALDDAGLELSGVPEPALYDPSDLIGEHEFDRQAAMQLAEDLRGTMKTHVVYAVPKGKAIAPPKSKPASIPHLKGVPAQALAQSVARKGVIKIKGSAGPVNVTVPKDSAPLIAMIDGRRPLAEIARAARLDPLAFGARWAPVERGLTAHGILHYSQLYRRG